MNQNGDKSGGADAAVFFIPEGPPSSAKGQEVERIKAPML
ncbi:hypothetical protein HM1_1880 [Heliomicrobium modesticaldum Ice1]|uniref:Uncharacterized protein n=1 Tax=Heliobacterium modesticaldum (strain ATCC 51547 / Ice1) TaxID=498761 RepID=B0TFC1_HELMI|nr:hypothetical protein HM1_1880 [Heliomicrobium modesticaldum Ice1]